MRTSTVLPASSSREAVAVFDVSSCTSRNPQEPQTAALPDRLDFRPDNVKPLLQQRRAHRGQPTRHRLLKALAANRKRLGTINCFWLSLKCIFLSWREIQWYSMVNKLSFYPSVKLATAHAIRLPTVNLHVTYVLGLCCTLLKFPLLIMLPFSHDLTCSGCVLCVLIQFFVR